jgi:hypothetical protein
VQLVGLQIGASPATAFLAQLAGIVATAAGGRIVRVGTAAIAAQLTVGAERPALGTTVLADLTLAALDALPGAAQLAARAALAEPFFLVAGLAVVGVTVVDALAAPWMTRLARPALRDALITATDLPLGAVVDAALAARLADLALAAPLAAPATAVLILQAEALALMRPPVAELALLAIAARDADTTTALLADIAADVAATTVARVVFNVLADAAAALLTIATELRFRTGACNRIT